jgi:hypothetical protein
MGVKQSKKGKERMLARVRIVVRRPIREGRVGTMGCFLSYLATTMMLLRSPILIPQHSYEFKIRVYGVKRTERTTSPDEFRLTFLCREQCSLAS